MYIEKTKPLSVPNPKAQAVKAKEQPMMDISNIKKASLRTRTKSQ